MANARDPQKMKHWNRAGLWAATFVYRWQMANGILSIVFSALTFLGVFALLLGPTSLFYLGLATVALMLGFGTLLDRVVKFWHPQSVIATTRNPFLVADFYQKELLLTKTSTLPQLEALRMLLTLMQFPTEPKYAEMRGKFVLQLDENISRIRQAVADKKWDIREGEDVYGGQSK